MSAESTLYSILSTAAGVTALVSTRIYPDLVPEEKSTPYIGYERVGSDPISTLHGTTLGHIARLVVACWADTRLAAEGLADAVEVALSGSDFSITARGAEMDEATNRLATTLDIEILA